MVHLIYGIRYRWISILIIFNIWSYRGKRNQVIWINCDILHAYILYSICKLYDYVFIDLNMDYLKTEDMQFGIKNNHSTVLYTAVYIETINHYMNEGSDVYSCLIELLTESIGGGTFFYPNWKESILYISSNISVCMIHVFICLLLLCMLFLICMFLSTTHFFLYSALNKFLLNWILAL